MKVLFLIIIKIFQFLGMCPISLNISDNKSATIYGRNIFLIIWNILNILSLCAYIILICVFYEFVLEHLSSIGEFSALTKGVTVLITHLIILCESLITRNEQGYLWAKVESVDCTFEKMGLKRDVYKSTFYRNYGLKFFSYQLFAWIAEICVLTRVHGNSSWQLFNYATIFSLMVSRTRHLHHALYIDMLTADFCQIKMQLEILVQASQSTVSMKDSINSLDKLKLTKIAYSLLYEISIHLNNIVSLSQLANMTQGFIYLTSDLHSLYMKLYVNDFAALPEICLSLLPTFIGLVLVMHSCEKCLGEVRFIGFLLHNIEKVDKRQQLDLIIENYSLQILHEPLGFSVAGFFSLDFMLLKAMVAAITTYMVIFIQFMPKEEVVNTETVSGANQTILSA